MTDPNRFRRYAAAKLAKLASCERVQFFQAGDELELCVYDGIPLISTGKGWQHDPRFIERLRETAADGAVR